MRHNLTQEDIRQLLDDLNLKDRKMTILEVLGKFKNSPSEQWVELILEKDVSAFILYLVMSVSQEELDSLEEGVYVPPCIQLFRRCEEGDISSILQALHKLGGLMGYDTQIIYPYEDLEEELI